MTKISKHELLKIAEIAKLELYDREIEPLIKQIEDVLTYAGRVKGVIDAYYQSAAQTINVLRDDVVVKTDYQPIIACAPESEQGYFVVPKIIENK